MPYADEFSPTTPHHLDDVWGVTNKYAYTHIAIPPVGMYRWKDKEFREKVLQHGYERVANTVLKDNLLRHVNTDTFVAFRLRQLSPEPWEIECLEQGVFDRLNPPAYKIYLDVWEFGSRNQSVVGGFDDSIYRTRLQIHTLNRRISSLHNTVEDLERELKSKTIVSIIKTKCKQLNASFLSHHEHSKRAFDEWFGQN